MTAPAAPFRALTPYARAAVIAPARPAPTPAAAWLAETALTLEAVAVTGGFTAEALS